MKIVFLAVAAIAFVAALVALGIWTFMTLAEKFICWILFGDEDI